jgi:3-oxoacyl-[acyl-carrier-protein] synthase III
VPDLAAITAPERAPALRELRGAAIGSAALAVPSTVLPNSTIAERLGVGEDWIEVRTGIRQRHALAEGERLSDIAAQAGAQALAHAGIDAVDVDLLLVATTSQDEVTPNTAPIVATELGAVNAAAIDIGAACTAFVSALQVATSYVESGRAETALVIGADGLSRFLDYDDRRTAALFGDGAGAVVMTATDEGRIGPILLRSEDAREMIMCHYDGKLVMQGQETFVNAVKRISEITLETLARAEVALEDVDLFVYHQANGRILSAVGDRLGLPSERVVDVIANYGNTSAASIPIALAEMQSAGRLNGGERVLIGAFGAGFTWGGALVEWGRDGA